MNLRAVGLATALLAVALPVTAAPAALPAYPDHEMERLDFLIRCAGLARAVQSSGFDIDYYAQFIGSDFARKDTQFRRILMVEAMKVFGFNPGDITIMDEGRTQLPHVRIVSSGIDREIEGSRGFYQTMSQFRQKEEWNAIVIADFETCGAAPID